MTQQESSAGLPAEIRRLVDETVEIVRTHPKHEMGQRQRRKIYTTLYSTPRGDRASRWLAILAARRVQPIYEQCIVASRYADVGPEKESAIGLVERMLEMAEAGAKGMLTKDDVRKGLETGEIEDFYHSNLVSHDDEFPFCGRLATLAADDALTEAFGYYRPLETTIGGEERGGNRNVVYTSSDTWSDDELVGGGVLDASVQAAYAFARMAIDGHYDANKLLEFWEWWLMEVIPQAWRKAQESRDC